jgi:hypothetical protein
MRSLEEIRRMKVDVHGGYNFIAFSPDSSFAALFERCSTRAEPRVDFRIGLGDKS